MTKTIVLTIPKEGLRLRLKKMIVNGKPVTSKKEYTIRQTKNGYEMI